MKKSGAIYAGKTVEAGEFKIIPIIRRNAVLTESGVIGSAEANGLIFIYDGDYLKFSFKDNDSWIKDFIEESPHSS
ncbi:MAG: hypothetical protein JXQ82_06185 [Methanomicrobiaceae archaeon]|nr:hypothetical protein [Methanomicrobiaceae archaeon]